MKKILFLVFICINVASLHAQVFKLQNPVTETWLKAHLRKEGPRIIITDEMLRQISKEVSENPVAKSYYQYLYKNAEAIIDLPVLGRIMTGRRLLMVSREAVKRIGTLSIVYAVSREKRFLSRVNAEMLALCNFSDWNPSHFLDVAEAAYAVAIGLDWTLGDLPAETKKLAIASLVDKAIKPGLITEKNGWIGGDNNWNQVCHGGLSVAAIAVARDYPALAATIIARALEHIPDARPPTLLMEPIRRARRTGNMVQAIRCSRFLLLKAPLEPTLVYRNPRVFWRALFLLRFLPGHPGVLQLL